MTIVEVSGTTHAGMVRHRNEDTIAISALSADRLVPADGTPHCVEAPLARRRCRWPRGSPERRRSEQDRRRDHRGARPTDVESLAKAICQANEAIISSMSPGTGNVGMGTTVVALLVTEQSLVVANVGDSSAWELVDGRLLQLSTDDTPPGRSSLPGIPSYIATPTLGGGPGLVDIKPHMLAAPIDGDRTVLICSDGLTNFVDRHAIATMLQASGASSSDALQLALEAGAPDNVTVAVLRMTPGQRATA